MGKGQQHNKQANKMRELHGLKSQNSKKQTRNNAFFIGAEKSINQ